MHEENYVNQTSYGVLSWRIITSCDSDLDTDLDKILENWKQILHEVSTRRCTRINCAVRWVGTEIREPPSFHGVNGSEEFLTIHEDEVLYN